MSCNCRACRNSCSPCYQSSPCTPFVPIVPCVPKTLSISFNLSNLTPVNNGNPLYGAVSVSPADQVVLNFVYESDSWKLVSTSDTPSTGTTITLPGLFGYDNSTFGGSITDYLAVNPSGFSIPYPFDAKAKSPVNFYVILRLPFIIKMLVNNLHLV